VKRVSSTLLPPPLNTLAPVVSQRSLSELHENLKLSRYVEDLKSISSEKTVVAQCLHHRKCALGVAGYTSIDSRVRAFRYLLKFDVRCTLAS